LELCCKVGLLLPEGFRVQSLFVGFFQRRLQFLFIIPNGLLEVLGLFFGFLLGLVGAGLEVFS
jgi:hypothetical protein